MLGAYLYYFFQNTGFYRKFYSNIAKEISGRFEKGARILDVGTGTGVLPALLADLGYNAVGVDLNKSFIELAKAKFGEKARFFAGDATKLKIGKFDLVISTFVLHHLENPAKDLEAMKKLLKDKGELWVIDLACCIEGAEKSRKNYGLAFYLFYRAIEKHFMSFAEIKDIFDQVNGYRSKELVKDGAFVKLVFS